MRREIRRILKLAAEVGTHLPNKSDGLLQKIGKGFAIAEKLYAALNGTNPIDQFCKENKLVRTNNGTLISLIFSSDLMLEFSKEEINLQTSVYGANLVILCLNHKELGSLYFIQKNFMSGETYKEHYILHKENFDFNKLMSLFWKIYDGRLYIAFTTDGLSCADFPSEKLQIYGTNAEVARDMAINHLRFAKDNISRTYLFCGEPGTGKSSCAMLFANKLGQRILKLEAGALVCAGKDLRFIITALKPDFVLLDDIDKDKMVKENMSSVLSSVEWIKVSNPDVTIIFTANELDKLDKAFWRPGRVDCIKRFAEPDYNDRLNIVKGFVEQFKVVLPSEYTIERIVKDTEGMSPVWLREIILRFKYEEPNDVIGICRQMHDIINHKPATIEQNGKSENGIPLDENGMPIDKGFVPTDVLLSKGLITKPMGS